MSGGASSIRCRDFKAGGVAAAGACSIFTRQPNEERTMGLAYAEIELSNPRDDSLKPVTARALVDTGATTLRLPEHIAIQLQLDEIERRDVVTADGERTLRLPSSARWCRPFWLLTVSACLVRAGKTSSALVDRLATRQKQFVPATSNPSDAVIRPNPTDFCTREKHAQKTLSGSAPRLNRYFTPKSPSAISWISSRHDLAAAH